MTNMMQLFSQEPLPQVLQAIEQEMYQEIDRLKDHYLLSTNVDQLCDSFERNYSRGIPKLQRDRMTMEPVTDVQVQAPFDRGIRERPGGTVSARQVRVHVPFEGPAALFRYRPSTSTTNWPRAAVEGDELIFTYTTTGPDPAAVKGKLEADLALIDQYLEWAAEDVSRFNSSLRAEARARIEARRQNILDDRRFESGLGIPLRRRDNAPVTYSVPEIRRKPPVALPPPGAPAAEPEPILDMDNYEFILTICSRMARVLELSPAAFREMREEDLRMHFLVQLNGQYEGMVTGETFNLEGKTDIIVKWKDKNLFIAECKFWDGPRSLTEAVDQLLRYTAWRDTSTEGGTSRLWLGRFLRSSQSIQTSSETSRRTHRKRGSASCCTIATTRSAS